MSHNRPTLIVAFLTPCLAAIIACGGAGNQQPVINTGPAPTPASSVPQEHPDVVTVREAKKAHDAAIVLRDRIVEENIAKKSKYDADFTDFTAKRDQIEARNAAKKKQYDDDVAAFKSADVEYRSRKSLDFVKNFALPTVVRAYYEQVVDDFPGTDAAKEAKRRLKGETPMPLPVPRQPVEPKQPEYEVLPMEPTRPSYESEPRVPELVTLEQLQEQRQKAIQEKIALAEASDRERKAAEEQRRREAARRAEEEFDANGLVLLNKSLHAVGGEITGTVINNRPRKLRYVQITFSLYDDSGARVGTALANINNLDSGERWNFRAVGFSNRWRTYRVDELIGF